MSESYLVTLGTIRASRPLVLQKAAAFLDPTLQFSFPAQTRNPFAIDMYKEAKEFRIPATELTDNGSLLDRLLAFGQGLIGNFGSKVLHDPNHVPVTIEEDVHEILGRGKEKTSYCEKVMVYLLDRNMGNLSGRKLTKLPNLLLQTVCLGLETGNRVLLLLKLLL